MFYVTGRPWLVLYVLSFCLLVPVRFHGESRSVAAQSAPASHAARASSQSTGPRPWMVASLSPERRAELLIQAMTLDDKITLMHGVNRIKGDAASGYDFDLPPDGYVGYVPQRMLREQIKFDGWVMSDWGARHSTVDSANHGLDQQMPIATCERLP